MTRPASETKFYYANIRDSRESEKKTWDALYPTLGPNGRFFLNTARFFGKNSFMARSGEWPVPWSMKLFPHLVMPAYDPQFKLSFSEITDQRAVEIKKKIHENNRRLTLYYSGGIDSTVCLVALLRNLTAEELSFINLAMSAESIIENPHFFASHIQGRFKIIDSAVERFSETATAGSTIISGEQGDSLFGTELGLQLLHTYGAEIISSDSAFSDYADLLIEFFKIDRDPGFGVKFYEQMVANIESAQIPVYSLQDFFWWKIFNLKYTECAVRTAIYLYNGNDRAKVLNEQIFNWFNHPDYQKWSMANNNNFQKMRGNSQLTYKWVAREYIREFDKNSWYFNHKTKLPSLKSILYRNEALLNEKPVFAMDTDCRLHYYTDTKVWELIEESLRNFN